MLTSMPPFREERGFETIIGSTALGAGRKGLCECSGGGGDGPVSISFQQTMILLDLALFVCQTPPSFIGTADGLHILFIGVERNMSTSRWMRHTTICPSM